MRELLGGPWSESRIAADMGGLQKTLQPRAHLLPSTVEAASTSILSFIKTRRAEIEAELSTPGPTWPAEATAAVTPPIALSGSFTAPWSLDAPLDPFSGGSGQMTISIEGRPQPAFAAVGAFATTNKQGDAAPVAAIREKYGLVSITGRVGTEIWQVSFTIDPFRIEAGPGTLPVDHYAVWALVVQSEGGRTKARLFGNVGELRLEQADARPGGAFRGTFTLRGFAP